MSNTAKHSPIAIATMRSASLTSTPPSRTTTLPIRSRSGRSSSSSSAASNDSTATVILAKPSQKNQEGTSVHSEDTSSSTFSRPSPPAQLTTTTNSQNPSPAEAFFRTHWTHLSQLAWVNDWYPHSCFQPAPVSQTTALSTPTSSSWLRNSPLRSTRAGLLDPAKLPLLASAVREAYYVYGPQYAWEVRPHVFLADDKFGEGNRGRLAWSYLGLEDVMKDEGVRRRGVEKNFSIQNVVLKFGGDGDKGMDRDLTYSDENGLLGLSLNDLSEDEALPMSDGEDSVQLSSDSSENGGDAEGGLVESDDEVWQTPFERRIVGRAL